MRTIKLILLATIMVALVLVAVANRELVTVGLLPDGMKFILPFEASVTLPLFVIILASVLVGLLLGYLLEYLRERKHRRAVTQKTREVSKLESEVEKLRRKTGEGEDDVLALLN